MLLGNRFRFVRLHPAQMLAGTFAALIAVGTALLMLPAATRTGESLSFVDALFTATSASCVTGLTVVDTGSTFSTFGQVVILLCIQVGGLGVVTFTALMVVLAGQRLSIVDRLAIQSSFHHSRLSNLGPLVRYIVLFTLSVEAAGALILTIHWYGSERFSDLATTAYFALFHSVSAFCNAGFGLYPDSLASFNRDATVQLTIIALIVTGGLGFVVGYEVQEWLRACLRRLRARRGTRGRGSTILIPHFSLHAKMVGSATAALIFGGTLTFYLTEGSQTLRELDESHRWLNALFCSVTTRTAGFSTVDFAQMKAASLLCAMVLMFVGAGPGSTGGGIKCSSFGLLVAYAWSRLRGYAELHAFRRTVAEESVDKAAAVTLTAMVVILLAVSGLSVTETLGLSAEASQSRLLGLTFETISAFGTVGLSTGETVRLSAAGKLIVTLVMFVGRTGPLTIAMALSLRKTTARFRYAEESVMVG